MPKYDEVADKKEAAVQEQKIRSLRSRGMSERDAVIAGLVSMKRKDSEPAAQVAPSEKPEYPYGLRFRLENEDLKKLGFKKLPEIGDTCKFVVEATPESVSSNQSSSGDSRECVEFQITDMKWDGADAAYEADKAGPRIPSESEEKAEGEED